MKETEKILLKHLSKINATKDVYHPKEWKLFLKAMEEYRQQEILTDKEIIQWYVKNIGDEGNPYNAGFCDGAKAMRDNEITKI